MNKTPQDGSPWSSVDQSADPSAFIRFLDKLRADDSVRAWKLQSYKYLEAKNGSHILDVGCGTGEDVRALAQHVGNTVRVVGVDSSEVMIVEAQKRANGLNLPVEFFVGNAHQLDFTESFDGCRADLTFQNLDNPQQALAELVRVARPGARIVLSEPDWETFIINADDRIVTRKILNYICDSHPNGWFGRQMMELFKEEGLTDLTVKPVTSVGTGYTELNQRFSIERRANVVFEAGIVSEDEVTSWLEQLMLQLLKDWRFP